ncbi:O-antigen ligase family protein [Spirosoma rhododendri]|uniref:O-antigen ligase domain-containing protein n=1 Tax=Spirosoma rhododendri TaxID=2728024 RepID=A0A7L5DUP4_9BACT|nr:O-antigen ligase family protein [Spirosoma rhododendri]QJD79280.1 O-antigen ligase domain-containing protein [Spirosoma rhododendri]
MAEQLAHLADQLRDSRWFYGVLSVFVALLTGWLIGTFGVMGGAVMVALPLALAVFAGILIEPKFGLLIYVTLSFLIGFTRFIPGDTPLGLALDAVLVLTLMATFLNGKQMNWKRLRTPIFYLMAIWLFYSILEYFNPEVPNPVAWFYKVRSIAFSWFLLVILTLVMPITRRDILWFLRMWIGWSLLAAFWAFKQHYIGLANAEVQWLAAGAAKTHMLWGQLRCFSFYSDAAQFGAEMAGATLITIVLLTSTHSALHRLIYVGLLLIFFWAYALSGTRSALFVLLGGILAFIALRRSIKTIMWGVGIMAPIMVILLFTHIGDSNYQIWRMRTALHPKEDASFMVRIENQQRLKAYMKDLPFGAGLGTSGSWGARFAPDHPAAQIPPDSWYVELWIETGLVGTVLYILMLIAIMTIGTYQIWQLNDPWLRTTMIIFLAEFFGICVMSYSNATLGQFPTSTLLGITSVLFTTCYRWDLGAPTTNRFQPAPGSTTAWPTH